MNQNLLQTMQNYKIYAVKQKICFHNIMNLILTMNLAGLIMKNKKQKKI
mgnify:CR=1 FL=1